MRQTHLSSINPRLNAVLWLLCRTPHLQVVQLQTQRAMVEHDSGSAGLVSYEARVIKRSNEDLTQDTI